MNDYLLPGNKLRFQTKILIWLCLAENPSLLFFFFNSPEGPLTFCFYYLSLPPLLYSSSAAAWHKHMNQLKFNRSFSSSSKSAWLIITMTDGCLRATEEAILDHTKRCSNIPIFPTPNTWNGLNPPPVPSKFNTITIPKECICIFFADIRGAWRFILNLIGSESW